MGAELGVGGDAQEATLGALGDRNAGEGPPAQAAVALEQADAAYQKMMAGAARFRMVLTYD